MVPGAHAPGYYCDAALQLMRVFGEEIGSRGYVGIVTVDTIELIGGRLPDRQQRLVEAWAEIHQAALLEDWDRLQGGRTPFKIEPLR